MSRVKLSKLSDEEIVKLMESVMTSDEEDSDIECDNGYEPEEICPEDEHLISQCLRDMDTSENVFTEDPNFSITTSAARDSVTADQEKVSSTGATYTALTSTPIQKKRARSLLPTFEDTGPAVVSTNGGFIGNIESISKDSAEFGKVVWRNTNLRLHVNEVAFRGATLLPENVKALSSPLQLFLYFFSEEIIDMIVQETNRCARSEDINTSFSVTADDVRKYIGSHLYMSIYRYPNIEAYWGKNAFEPIRKTMPVKRFLAIKRFISFRDEEERVRKGQPGYDPLFRIRNFSNILNERFDSIPKHARLCVDEQMCSTKMKHHLRQYMPNKPHNWGIKLFVLCDSYGYAYRFEIYNGAGDNVILPNCPDLGSSANVVVRLSQTVNNLMNHIIYFDNFYTSLPLLVYLRARGIFGLGTIRMNRIPNCKLPPDSVIVKKERGFSTEYVGSAYGIDISTVVWKDNKSVRLASTYVAVEPFIRSNPNKDLPKAKRYDRKKKQHIQVNCPQIIREYNSHMGGVDLMDGLMGRYHVRAKTRDAMTRLFYHFIDMASTNAYILYKRISAEKMNDSNNIPEKGEKMLQLPEFREEIAAGLVNCTQIRLVGRPSTSSQPPITQVESLPDTLNIGRKAVHPVDDVRFSNNTHLPKWLDKKGGKKWCKLCKKSQTQCVCEICNLHLCCSATKNCFSEYHTKT